MSGRTTRSLIVPTVVWDDESYSRAPHHVAAAAIVYYVESKRKCGVLGCEKIRRIGVAYWPFLLSRRSDGRLVAYDLLGLHSFSTRIVVVERVEDIISFAGEVKGVGASYARSFALKLVEMLTSQTRSFTEEFKGIPEDADHIEQLTLISRDGRPRSECVMEQAVTVEDAERLLEKLDNLCYRLLEEYKILEKLYETIVSASERMAESIEAEMRRVIREYRRAVRAVHVRISSRIASVRDEMEKAVSEVWEKYSRQLGELSALLDEARREGRRGEAVKIERMISKVKERYEREASSIEERYARVARSEYMELRSLEREKERKLNMLRRERNGLQREIELLTQKLSKLLDVIIEVRSRLCRAGTVSPYAVEADKALLYVPVIVAETSKTRRILVPILAVAREPSLADPVRPLTASRGLVNLLDVKGGSKWVVGLRGDCLVDSGSFRKLALSGLEELAKLGVVERRDVEKLKHSLEFYWFTA